MKLIPLCVLCVLCGLNSGCRDSAAQKRIAAAEEKIQALEKRLEEIQGPKEIADAPYAHARPGILPMTAEPLPATIPSLPTEINLMHGDVVGHGQLIDLLRDEQRTDARPRTGFAPTRDRPDRRAYRPTQADQKIGILPPCPFFPPHSWSKK